MISIANTATRTLMMRKSVTTIGRRCLSVQGEEAVGRLKDALEQYRAANYQQTIPTRFKKEMISCAANNRIPSPTAKDDKMVAVEGIENLLQNIGVFGKQVTHDDVETIVSELGAEEADAVRAESTIKSYICDVTSEASVESTVDEVIQQFGACPDLLWNNAGYQGQIKPTLDYSVADFALVMNINVTGMFIVMQTVAKRMAAANKNNEFKYAIVNTASVAALRGTPAMIAYSSSKAAVITMTVCAAKDLAPHGIRVNAVSPALIGPGYMWTRQNELHAKSNSPYFSTNPEENAKNKVNSVPMKRLGSVEEVVKSVAFLLSDESTYTTAFNLVVDGGLSGGIH